MSVSPAGSGIPRDIVLPDGALAALEQDVDRALNTGDASELDVVGYGEISCVLALDLPEGTVVCKRLPLFDTRARADAYRGCFVEYLERLEDCGILPCPSRLVFLERADGRIAGYCVQPMLPPSSLGPTWLSSVSPEEGTRLFHRLVELVSHSVGSSLGLDGQLSNWAIVDGHLYYLDVTTPLMRDDQGRERLDTELFICSLPWALRGLVRRLLLHQILDKYYQPRGVLLDFVANLYKERLESWIPLLLEALAERVSPPLTVEEVRGYYRQDARMWALLQRLRRADRWWQRYVRRRTYPFLLPGRVARNL